METDWDDGFMQKQVSPTCRGTEKYAFYWGRQTQVSLKALIIGPLLEVYYECPGTLIGTWYLCLSNEDPCGKSTY